MRICCIFYLTIRSYISGVLLHEQAGSIVDEEQEQLMQAVRPIVQQAVEQGKISEDRSKHFLHSGNILHFYLLNTG